ncbi:MAG: DUF4386 family protein [Acidimicrobiales bacterium]
MKRPIMNNTTTAVALIGAAVLANAGFTVLGDVFNYPDVLKEPGVEVLRRFHDNQGTVATWFTVLALSSALFAPIAVGVGRLRDDAAMKLAVPIGIAAAAVQVIGLSRWPLLVPGFASDAVGADPTAAAAAVDHFHTAGKVLGTAIGETCGYALTGAWTLLVVKSLGRRFSGTGFLGKAFSGLGGISAVMILAGVLSPLDIDAIDGINFAGYVLWSVWLVWFAVALLRTRSSVREPAMQMVGS